METADGAILAPGAESGKFYANRITWNGKEITDAQLLHKDLMQGGTLRFAMSSVAH